MIKDLITKSFKARNTAHANHWTTNSYAQHKALGNFYQDLIDALDKYVEAYQGTFGQLEWVPDQVDDIIKTLREEMVALYMKTLYKLESLR